MPRARGQDKAESEARKRAESVLFNARFVVDDLRLLRLLIQQEMRRRESPSDRLVNADEIAARLLKLNEEILEAK